MNERLEQALGYEAKGWAVIPIRPDDKKPIIEWKQYQDRRPSQTEIKEWWTKYPNANIGVLTGRISGIVVVDVDPRHGGESAPIEHEWPTGLIAKTANAGFHLVYKYPDDAEYIPSLGAIQQGIDIRADGGYIVVCPSTLGGDKKYRWIEVGDLGAPPPWAVQDRKQFGPPKGGYEWFKDMLARGESEGGRNEGAARIAGLLYQRGFQPDEALGLIGLWNRDNRPPLTDDELRAVVFSIWRTHQARTPQVSSTSPLEPLTLGKIGETEPQPVNWLIDEWLPEEAGYIMVAPPQSFKSWLALAACTAVAGGIPFLGKYPVKQGTSIYLQLEDHNASTINRFHALRNTYGLDKNIPALHITSGGYLNISTQEGIDELAGIVREYNPRLVVIDPLHAVASHDDFMRDFSQRLLHLKAIARENHCSFLICHHTKKSAEDRTDPQNIWGSQFINAAKDGLWMVNKVDPHTISVRRSSKITGDKKPLGLRWLIASEGDIIVSAQTYEVDIDSERAKLADPFDTPHKERMQSLNKLKREAMDMRLAIFIRECDGFSITKAEKGRLPKELHINRIHGSCVITAPGQANARGRVNRMIDDSILVKEGANTNTRYKLTNDGERAVEQYIDEMIKIQAGGQGDSERQDSEDYSDVGS